MRQVNRDELAYMIAGALRGSSRATLKLLVDARDVQRRQAQAMIALAIVEALKPFEILSDRHLPSLMGENTYSVPIARMLGEDLPSGVVPASVEPASKQD